MSRQKGSCPKCDRYRPLTHHHIYPRRWRWPEDIQNQIVELCRVCHDDLEKIIDRQEKMHWGRRQLSAAMYLALLGTFMIGGRDG